MAPVIRRTAALLLLVSLAFPAGGDGLQLVLCVPSEGAVAVEFVSDHPATSKTYCPHENCTTAFTPVNARPTCSGHHARCVDIPLSTSALAVTAKSRTAPSPRLTFGRCPLPLTEVVASTGRAAAPLSPPCER